MTAAGSTPALQLKYLQGYDAATLSRIEELMLSQRLGPWLLARYPQSHAVRTDKALFDYAQQLRLTFLRGAEPLAKVVFDSKLQVMRQALGTHTSVSRVQGSRLTAKREIRIAALFKDVPAEFLRMIVVHELAHLKEREHDKAFYQLCSHMEPDYHQLEFEVRVYLTYLEQSGTRLWGQAG